MHKYFDDSHCFLAADLFNTFDTKKHLKITKRTIYEKYGTRNKQLFCAKVLLYAFYIILLDIIENNVTFVMPTKGRQHGIIHVKPFYDDDFKEGLSKGLFKGIDWFASGFTGYILEMVWRASGENRTKPIYINNKLKQKWYDNINAGKKYY